MRILGTRVKRKRSGKGRPGRSSGARGALGRAGRSQRRRGRRREGQRRLTEGGRSTVGPHPFSRGLRDFRHRNSVILSSTEGVNVLGSLAGCNTAFVPLSLGVRRGRGTILCVTLHSTCRGLCACRTRRRARGGRVHRDLGICCSTFFVHFNGLGTGRGIGFVLVSTSKHSVLSLRQIRGKRFAGSSVFSRPMSFSLSRIDHISSPRRTLATSLGGFNHVSLPCVARLSSVPRRRLARTLGKHVCCGPLVSNCRVTSHFVTNGMVRGTRHVRR